MSKHDPPAHPVFPHTHDATWTHLTVVMAALTLGPVAEGVVVGGVVAGCG